MRAKFAEFDEYQLQKHNKQKDGLKSCAVLPIKSKLSKMIEKSVQFMIEMQFMFFFVF